MNGMVEGVCAVNPGQEQMRTVGTISGVAGARPDQACIFLCTGEGSHSVQTDVASLVAGPLWPASKYHMFMHST